MVGRSTDGLMLNAGDVDRAPPPRVPHASTRRGGPAPEHSRGRAPTAQIDPHPSHRTAARRPSSPIYPPPPDLSVSSTLEGKEREKKRKGEFVSRLVSSSSPPIIPEQLLETLAASIPAMAEPNPQVEEREVEQEEVRRPKLRYLEFVQVAAAQATICLAGLYALAKDHAGPLRPGVDAVESAVKGVVGPVYGRFHGVPLDVLAFVDRKNSVLILLGMWKHGRNYYVFLLTEVNHKSQVDDTVQELDRHLPPTLKSASAKACAMARGVPDVARELTAEVQQSGVTGAARVAYAKVEPVAKGVYGKIQPAAKDLYVRYEPAAEHLAVSTWRSLNNLPLFPQVAQIAVPTAAYWAEKYNKVIAAAADKGYTGAQYLPAIPTERIAKVFGESSPEAQPSKSESAKTQ
uniref:Stress-related protein n=1 Tax=Oryza meridionalis TaxID=40149 RepID=A0A0E0EG16_9ORYZ